MLGSEIAPRSIRDLLSSLPEEIPQRPVRQPMINPEERFMSRRISLIRLAAILAALLLGASLPTNSYAQFAGWNHSGSIFILTTPDGADLPADESVEQFPLLVRLHRDTFDFSQARPDGADLRFALPDGTALPFQIEQWDAKLGEAAAWVRIPKIQGAATQELRVFWGNVSATSESRGADVFNGTNKYASVWHLGEAVVDEVGTIESKDVGTTLVPGRIGAARRLAGRQGVFGGTMIPNYPSGGAPHSTEAWFRAERPNVTILGWGNEGGGRGSKVRMQLRSPPHVHIDSDFSDVDAPERLRMGEWIHVVHTYAEGVGRIYIDGRLAGEAKPTLAIKSPARLWLGGWYDNYDFVGDLDEVRISRTARSAAWIKLQYENQKPYSTLVGPLVPAGAEFQLSASKLNVAEGANAPITARAGGARKIYWILKRDGRESVVATDCLNYQFDAGRVVGAQSATLVCKAITAAGAKSREVAITITDDIPEPLVSLDAPASWDGRRTIEVTPKIENLPALRARGAERLNYAWTVDGLATIRRVEPGKLVLERAQNSGTLTVHVAVDNGGAKVAASTKIEVREPPAEHEPWIARPLTADERPVDGQFFARDLRDEAQVHYRGKLAATADSAFVRLYADERLVQTATQRLDGKLDYALSVALKPGLVKYRVEFGTKTGDREAMLQSAENLVCGDVFLIIGQSNAVATDFGKDDPLEPTDWVRTFGATDGGPQGSRLKLWANAVARSPGGKSEIGYWGLDLGRQLVERHKIPVCILNGAVGGTRVDQHQRNPADPTDVATIYGRLLWRVREAKLTHGVRAIFWHQGENDQGADGPTGGFGWETYRDYFIDLAAAWKQDYPNVRRYYAFQIWPKACSMGVNGSDNKLREVQRSLPRYFANLSVLSTVGIKPPGGCHFPREGYAQFARLLLPAIDSQVYGARLELPATPPDLKRVFFAEESREELVLEFDQPVEWSDKLTSQFYLDGKAKLVASGIAQGRQLRLKLVEPSQATRVTYLDSASWSPDNLLFGTNGLAALTFCDVPIEK